MRDIIDHIPLRPSYCVWEITSRCNLNCLHCASRAKEDGRGDELSRTEALKICSDLYELGCSTVVLSGGEALLRDDWEQIAVELGGMGILVELISNGFSLTSEMAARIKEAGIGRVALSLDGLEATHNRIRQNKDSFQRVMAAAKYVKREGLPLNAVTHVNRLNLPELPDMHQMIEAAAFDVWRIQLAAPLGRMSEHRDLMLLPEDLPTLADFIVRRKSRGRVAISVGDNIGYFSNHEHYLRNGPGIDGCNFWCGCLAGCLSIGIEANGNVKGCLSLQSDEFIEGNIRTESLREIWDKKGNFSYNRGFRLEHLHGHCSNCEYGELCRGGCIFMAYSTTGSPHNNPYCLHAVMRSS